MSKIIAHNVPSQTVRAMSKKLPSIMSYGHLPSHLKNSKITTKHLLFIYLSSKSSERDNIWKFYKPIKAIAEDMGLSERQVARSLLELVKEKTIIKTKVCRDRTFVYIIARPYRAKEDYLMLDVVVTSKVIPLSFKLFMVRLQLTMESTKKSHIIFKAQRELRLICNDHEILSNNLAELEKRNLLVYKENHTEIHIKDVYLYLYAEYRNEKEREILSPHDI